jgi:diguanylate cyclase (GGDEF)-like protein/PAS domain S-box-containing protein
MPYKRFFNFSDNYFIQKIRPEIDKQIVISFIKVYLLQLFIFISCIYLGFYLYNRQQVQITLAEEVKHIQSAPFILTENFETISADLMLLQSDEYIRSYIESSDNSTLLRLKERFTFFAKSRAIYHQVRLIDENGMEVIRINNNNGEVQMVQDNELQDKSNRYYFKETNKLGKNEIFISPLDPNIEHGILETPLRPTTRFGIPIFSKTGKNKGIVLLNYDFKPTLSKFSEHFVSTESIEYSIITFDGSYILSQDAEKEFSSTHSFADDHTSVWDKLLKSERSQTKSEEGIFTILVFKPITLMQEYLSKSLKNINMVGVEGDATQRKLAIVSHITSKLEFNFFASQSLRLILLYLFVQVMTAFLIWKSVQNRVLNNELRIWMSFFFQGIEKNPASIVLTDRNRKILYTNSKFLELTGYSQEEVYLQNTSILKSGEMSDIGYKNLWETLSAGKTWTGEFHNKTKNNSMYWVLTSITPIFNEQGDIIRYLGIQEDITIRKQLQEQLERRASTDSLTSLENRHSFFSKMEVEIERSHRGNHVFSLLMIDIDFFKKINDQYGHQAGDEVLKDLSTLLKESTRTVDLCARYGGEEFIIVMPETSLKSAKISAERIRKRVEQHIVNCDDAVINYTLSIGMTQWNAKEKLEDTIARADSNLYQAKEAGRNRVIDC